MNILVTGANGFVGQYLVKHLLYKGHSVTATGKGPARSSFSLNNTNYISMDFSDPAEVNKILALVNPSVIVHAGAMSKPNDCEIQRDLAWKINVNGTQNLLEAAARVKSFFIFISTDFVFDGEKGMYSEPDETNPVNYYGQTKLAAEGLVRSYEYDWSIVRTILVYGKPVRGSSNILTLIRSKLQNEESYNVVNDQFRTPTYVEDLVEGITAIIEKKAKGIFHISGEEIMTPYEMACRMADHFGYDKKLLKEVNASVFPEPARRPPCTGFNIEKAKKELGYCATSFEEGLGLTFDD
ncbi:MAG TPA: SDR family oxidoreductase [Chitinophagaceae bacterium]|nr:SDR family oxidoreductase [Chitinophagaceae bacterium]